MPGHAARSSGPGARAQGRVHTARDDSGTPMRPLWAARPVLSANAGTWAEILHSNIDTCLVQWWPIPE